MGFQASDHFLQLFLLDGVLGQCLVPERGEELFDRLVADEVDHLDHRGVAVPDEEVLFWQLCGIAVTVTVYDPPGLVLLLVLIVRVDVLVTAVLVRTAGLKENDPPVGSPVAFRFTVQELLLPLNVRLTL